MIEFNQSNPKKNKNQKKDRRKTAHEAETQTLELCEPIVSRYPPVGKHWYLRYEFSILIVWSIEEPIKWEVYLFQIIHILCNVNIVILHTNILESLTFLIVFGE